MTLYTKTTLVLLGGILMVACPPAHEGDDPGECEDGADNDRDGVFDCGDSDCAFAPACQGEGDDDDSAAGDDDDAVADPCRDGAPLLVEFEVSFPPTRGCSWGENGNQDATQGEVSGRTEQAVTVDMPAGAVVCGLDFDFAGFEDAEQQMVYDDQFLFTFNDVVLAASHSGMVGALDLIDGLPQYDWSDLVGWEFQGAPTPFCLNEGNGSSCEIPEPEEAAAYALSFGGALVDGLTEQAVASNEYTFTFVVTGDDNPGDCTHEGFEITMGAALVAE